MTCPELVRTRERRRVRETLKLVAWERRGQPTGRRKMNGEDMTSLLQREENKVQIHCTCACAYRSVQISNRNFTIAFFIMYVTCYLLVHVHADVGATPTPSAGSSSQSLFSRLVSAITPSHLTRHALRPSELTPHLMNTNYTPARSNKGHASITDRSKFKTPSVRLRTNKTTTPASSVKLSNLPHKNGDIEMKDFSMSMKQATCRTLSTSHCDTGKSGEEKKIPNFKSGNTFTFELDSKFPDPESPTPNLTTFRDSSGSDNLHVPIPHPTSTGSGAKRARNHDDGCTLNSASPLASVTPSVVRRRRSVRVAKRRSIGRQGRGSAAASPLFDGGSFPVPSLLSPVSLFSSLHVATGVNTELPHVHSYIICN